MADGDAPSSQTLGNSSPPPESIVKLDLAHLPPIFVLATHFETDDLHELEEELADAGALLTYDVTEARVILSKVVKPKRIQFDLRGKGLWTEQVKVQPRKDSTTEDEASQRSQPPAKKRRLVEQNVGTSLGDAIVIDDESTDAEAEASARAKAKKNGVVDLKQSRSHVARTLSPTLLKEEEMIKIVKVAWFEDSRKAGTALPLDEYLTLQCRRIERPGAEQTPPTKTPVKLFMKPITATTNTAIAANPHADNHILERAKEDAEHAPKSYDRFGKRRFDHHVPAGKEASWAAGHGTSAKYAHLLQETTTEHDEGISSELPEMPEWVREGVKYACQRCTPKACPNDPFLALLKTIKLARLLTNDEIGVRAYSTSIASLAAYPYKLTSPREIMALPGCDAKIANLFVEWANTGTIQAVEDIEQDAELTTLRLFYEIWGVGATTAREFYYDRGWRDLDDVVEFGWAGLTRVQQIGVKYYDEFLDPIPRAEVEAIGRVIHRHAVQVRDAGVQTLIVGGYRRGKEACGDVDLIVSHPDEAQTLNLVNDTVASLEGEGWVTHTLLLSLHATHRGQQTLPFRTGNGAGGHGFDTLDKALVVWQDPQWDTQAADLAADPAAKNPNIHRRVDIIIAPWRTVGCAVAGWSGGTTFQRDLRRYAKHVKGWKFDSSGVRDRGNGECVDLEGFFAAGEEGRAKGMVEAERRVFEGLGLVWREAWERCTG
ncbi:hypothetical protein LTR36_009696 [Oleoguttula mirabilis]|uniref:DNA-directed DNA polymerase n=1 Tax=Oleoguttula mirabilis TaxID=1507867 RepID=A0AAV9J5H7_9PEZI|nr:hypothetical protein LTR36_009696 [Oleoguttula mirabilis]